MWVEFPWVKYLWMNLPDAEKMFDEFSVGEISSLSGIDKHLKQNDKRLVANNQFY